MELTLDMLVVPEELDDGLEVLPDADVDVPVDREVEVPVLLVLAVPGFVPAIVGSVCRTSLLSSPQETASDIDIITSINAAIDASKGEL